MLQYYYFDEVKEKEVGPLDIEQLKIVGIKPETLIWTEGLEKWKTAEELDELKVLFKAPPPLPPLPPRLPTVSSISPPPVRGFTENSVETSNKNKNLVALLVVILVILVGIFIMLGVDRSEKNEIKRQEKEATEWLRRRWGI